MATITSSGDVKITIGAITRRDVSTELDAIQLSIFSHRFMSIAEQMGRCENKAILGLFLVAKWNVHSGGYKWPAPMFQCAAENCYINEH